MRQPCEFQLLRYVPDAVRNEGVHIGVILRAAGGGPAEVRFTRDWRRVRCLDADADTALLEGMESELRRRFAQEREKKSEAAAQGGLLRLLSESLSLGVQMTESRAYLAESIPAGLEELMRLYVEPPPKEKAPRLSGRAALQASMRREFEHAGVWDLLRKRIAAQDYTRPGDPLRIDLGYRPNGMIRMFHAVSLESGVDAAKGLAFSAAALRLGVERVEKAALELTAIVEPAAKVGATDGEPERLETYRFGVETMEEHAIRVLTASDLGRVAEAARRELRV
jgi:hypothetical protein